MVAKLTRNQFGVYEYQDAAVTSAPVNNIDQFEAYTGTQKTTLATGTTDLGTQTQSLLREAPGQMDIVTDPQTGETKTVARGQTPVDIQQQAIDTSKALTPRQSPFEKIQGITSTRQDTGFTPDAYLNRIQQMQNDALKAQRVNTLLKGGLDLGVAYLKGSKPLNIQQTTTPLLNVAATPVGQSTLGGVGLAGGIGYGISRALGGDKKESTAAGAGAAIGTAFGGPIGGVVGGTIGKVVGGRVICTELYNQGLISRKDWALDLRFTESHLTPEHIKGYWYFAIPAVKSMRKSKLSTKFWKHIAVNRIKDVKWRLGKGKFNLLGRIYSSILEPLCKFTGKFVKEKDYHKELYA